MNIALDIDFNDKVVLILGGGKVAYRKATQFLNGGAIVYLSSPNYDPLFDGLTIHKVDETTLIRLLDRSSLAIAASDDRATNQRFIQCANAHHVLTMSCHKDDGQTTHPMVSIHENDLTIALHTNGAFPSLNRPLLQKLSSYIAQLSHLRNQLSNKSFAPLLTELTPLQIQTLSNGFNHPMIVYLLHGGSGSAAMHAIEHLVKITKENLRIDASYLFIGKHHQTLTLEQWIQLLDGLTIHPIYILLFWNDGTYTQNATQLLNKHHALYHRYQPDVSLILHPKEVPIYHTDDSTIDNGVLVSLVYSTYLASHYPNTPYRVYLEHPNAIQHILNNVQYWLQP